MNLNIRINFRGIYFMLCEEDHDLSGCTIFTRFLTRCVIMNISSKALYHGAQPSIGSGEELQTA
jgi:hypothetical protein